MTGAAAMTLSDDDLQATALETMFADIAAMLDDAVLVAVGEFFHQHTPVLHAGATATRTTVGASTTVTLAAADDDPNQAGATGTTTTAGAS